MSQVDKKDEVDHVEDGRYTLEARAEDGAPKTRDLGAITFINDRERNLSTWEGIKRYRVALFYAFFLSLGALLSGLDGSISTGVVAIPAFRNDMGTLVGGNQVVPASWQSAWNGFTRLMQLFGGLSGGWLADRIGRKGAVACAAVLSTAMIFVQFFLQPQAFVQLLMGRGINGYAIGIFVTMSSTYTSEISPMPIRGLTTGGVNFWVVIGQFLASLIVYGCGLRTDSYAYRIPFAIQWVVPLVMFVALPFIPESPWYLVRRGTPDKALRSLARLYRGSGDDIEQHLARIQEVIYIETHNKEDGSFLDLFRGTNRLRTFVASMVFVCQEMVGVQFVLGFATYFFELAGFPTAKAFKLNIGTLALAIVGNLIGLFLINRVGRRPLFFWGMIVCTLDCLGLGICSVIPGQPALWGQASFTMLYMLCYQAGIGVCAYALYSEISSAKLRTKTVAWGVCINQLFVGVTQVFLPYLVNPNEANLEGKVGWIFFGIGVAASIWAWFFVPETMGRNVDEIDELFNRHISPRKFHKTVLDEDRTATFRVQV